MTKLKKTKTDETSLVFRQTKRDGTFFRGGKGGSTGILIKDNKIQIIVSHLQTHRYENTVIEEFELRTKLDVERIKLFLKKNKTLCKTK